MNKFFFDYFYYRLTKFYFKWDKRNSITAVLAISMFQSSTIGSIILVFLRRSYSRQQLAPYSKIIGYSGVALLLLFAFYNYRKYYNKYFKFKSIWGDEKKSTRTAKGVLMISCLIAPFVVLIYWGLKK